MMDEACSERLVPEWQPRDTKGGCRGTARRRVQQHASRSLLLGAGLAAAARCVGEGAVLSLERPGYVHVPLYRITLLPTLSASERLSRLSSDGPHGGEMADQWIAAMIPSASSPAPTSAKMRREVLAPSVETPGCCHPVAWRRHRLAIFWSLASFVGWGGPARVEKE